MAVSQTSKVVVINDLSTVAATERIRTTGAGTKTRFTVDIKSEPVGVVVDPKLLGAPVAAAIAKRVADGIRGITVTASESTLLFRKYAADALAKGKGWARRRYSGGRTAAASPDQSDRLFNDSGRLANGVVARAQDDGSYTINVTANRLDPSTFGLASFLGMIARLFELVDVLRDPSLLSRDPGVEQAIELATEKAVVVMKDASDAAKLELLGELKVFEQRIEQLGSEVDVEEKDDQQEQQP